MYQEVKWGRNLVFSKFTDTRIMISKGMVSKGQYSKFGTVKGFQYSFWKKLGSKKGHQY